MFYSIYKLVHSKYLIFKEKRESRSWFSERKIAVVRDLEQGPRDLWIQRMASFAIGRITKYEPQDTQNFNLRT